ncbi:MAG: hypothetical protein KME49_10765 [Brasilonema octagenarum HA4186-MV1]|nr:hypothetical protein [Brasilonema octagenarum HA4186-MV1]
MVSPKNTVWYKLFRFSLTAYPANSVGKTNELDDCGYVATVDHNSMDNAVKA